MDRGDNRIHRVAVGIDFVSVDLYPQAAFVSETYAAAVRYWAAPRVWIAAGVGQGEVSGAGRVLTRC